MLIGGGQRGCRERELVAVGRLQAQGEHLVAPGRGEVGVCSVSSSPRCGSPDGSRAAIVPLNAPSDAHSNAAGPLATTARARCSLCMVSNRAVNAAKVALALDWVTLAADGRGVVTRCRLAGSADNST